MKFDPHNYQFEAILFGVLRREAALFLDPGLGKTAISLAIFRALRALGIARRGLVIAPLRCVYSVWPTERDKWDGFSDVSTSIVHGSETQRLEALQADADLYLINPAGIVWLQKIHSGERRRELKRELKKTDQAIEALIESPTGGPAAAKLETRARAIERLLLKVQDAKLPDGLDILFVDESTKFKRQNSRFLALKKLLDLFRSRYILTGTPTPRSYEDLYSQIFILDQGERLGRTLTDYRDHYFSKAGYEQREYFIYPGAAELIQEKIADLTLRLDAGDHLDLPDLVINDIVVDLDPKAKKIYRSMEEKLFAEIESREVFALSGSSKYLACKQIANGGIYSTDLFDEPGAPKVVVPVHSGKIDVVESLVAELQGKPLLVGYLYRHDLDRLRERFGADLPAIGADTSGRSPKPDEVTELVRQWNEGEIPLLAAQPASMAHGLNMQAVANHIAWLGVPDDFELYDQFIRRIWRQGVDGRVFVHRILARGTVDFVTLYRNEDKDRAQMGLLNALRDYRKGLF